MIQDNAGAKSLIASVLNQALQDYANSSGCPEGCLFAAECPQWKIDAKYQDAKAFIHSDWCGALCEGVEVLVWLEGRGSPPMGFGPETNHDLVF